MPSTATPKQTPTFSAPTACMSSGAVISALWQRAFSTMSREELEWFSGASCHAETMTHNLREVIEGIGCLVSADETAGNFQEKGSVTTLLFSIEHSLSTIQAMINVGAGADYKLRAPVKGGV